jgi:hypothetical protein
MILVREAVLLAVTILGGTEEFAPVVSVGFRLVFIYYYKGLTGVLFELKCNMKKKNTHSHPSHLLSPFTITVTIIRIQFRTILKPLTLTTYIKHTHTHTHT